jgi:hypothetical protein
VNVPDWRTLIANPKIQVGGVVAVGVLLGLLGWFLHASASPPAAPTATQAPPAASGTPAEGASTGAAAPASGPAEPPKTTAEITFTTNPSANATVSWGKTRLGVIGPKAPLVIVRPRDSGPLDVMVRAVGYLPVQTRAHTFGDSRIVVKLTKPDQTQSLVGYKAPIDAGIIPEESASEPPPFP